MSTKIKEEIKVFSKAKQKPTTLLYCWNKTRGSFYEDENGDRYTADEAYKNFEFINDQQGKLFE
jgi:hypothetical protein